MTRVLIVEDEERIASFLVKGLRSHGFASEVVGTAEDGLARALSGDFAIVILDIGLPDHDGFWMLSRLRSRDEALPVVILTSSKEDRDLIEGYRLGTNSYVQKPIDFNQFSEAVRQVGLYWLIVNVPPPS